MTQPKPDIRFDPLLHRYWDEATGAEYLSVTQLIARHKPIFDEAAASLRIALRDGKAQEQVLAEWALKRDTATERGTLVHSLADSLVRHGQWDYEWLWLLSAAHHWIDQHAPDTVLSERMVFHAPSRTAGTMDLGFVYRQPRRIVICDYKTHEEGIKRQSWGRKMLPPLDHLDDSDFIHIALQLSLYGMMWELMGYAVEALWALWVRFDRQGIEPTRLPYLRKEAMALLDKRRGEIVDK